MLGVGIEGVQGGEKEGDSRIASSKVSTEAQEFREGEEKEFIQ